MFTNREHLILVNKRVACKPRAVLLPILCWTMLLP